MIKRGFPLKETVKMFLLRKLIPTDVYKKKELKKILAIAGENPFYRRLYEGIDLDRITPENISELPFVTKDMLMDNFDDWACDEKVRLADLMEFGNNPANNGKLFLDKYHVCSSSGTSKRMFYSLEDRGDFDRETIMGIFSGLPYLKYQLAMALGLGKLSLIIPLAAPYSFSMVCEYFATITTEGSADCIDVVTPIDEMVERLNSRQPLILGGYLLTLLELADEAEKGNLNIHPGIILTTGDTYKTEQRRRLESVFGCTTVGMYASTECGIIAFADNASYYRVNEEIIVEPVDEDNRPIKEGEISDHVFVTCLWRKGFPIIRYRLDDKCMLVREGADMRILPAGRDTPLLIVEQNGKIAKINGYGILNITEEYNANIYSQLIIDRDCNIGINVAGNPDECERYITEVQRRVRAHLKEKYDVVPNFYRLDGPFEKLKSGKYGELIYRG